MLDHSISIDKPEDRCKAGSIDLYLSGRRRDLLIKRLASFGLPTREIVRLTRTSSRTVARTMQRLGIKRKRPDRIKFPFPRKRQARQLASLLTRYYALDRVTLSDLHHLADQNGIAFKKLLTLIREHVSPSRWAIRTCLACDESALTASSSDRYCQTCKKKMQKVREGIQDVAIYE